MSPNEPSLGANPGSGSLSERRRSIARVAVLATLWLTTVAAGAALFNQLGNDLRQAELISKEVLLHSLGRGLTWAGVGFGMSWGVLVLWLLYAAQSVRRFSGVAADRQQAGRAMEQVISTERRFLGIVNHELRSPPQNTAAIGHLRRAIWGLQVQLRDLLTIARSDTGEPGVLLETFDCSELVRDVCAEFEGAAFGKGLALRVKLPDQPQVVHADPIRIAQLLRKLLQNAVRQTSAGRVDVELQAPAGTDGSHPTGWMRFTVCDTGPGIAAEDIMRLHSEQAAIELGADDPRKSLRIDLFVIRDLLRQLSGHIEVSSEPGQGTAMRVRIPVAVPADTMDAHTDTVAAGHGNDDGALHVLIVDSRQDVLHALCEAVHQLGHRCDMAASSAQAEPLLARSRYDAVLIDLETPGKNGLAFAMDIRSGTHNSTSGNTGGNTSRNTSGTENISHSDSMLILISAPENREVGQRPPFDGFLQKPIGTEDIKGLIGSRTRH